MQNLGAEIPLRAVPARELPALGIGEQWRRVVAPIRRRGQAGEHPPVRLGRLPRLGAGDLAAVGEQREADLAGRLVEGGGEREVVLFEGAVAQDLEPRDRLDAVVDVEVDEIEGGLEELAPAALALQLGHREAPVEEGVALDPEGLVHQLPPGAARQPHTQRQCVEKESQHPLAVGHLRPPVRHQAGDHVGLAGEQRHGAQVGGEQHALERRARLAGERADGALDRRRQLDRQLAHAGREAGGEGRRPARQACEAGARELAAPEGAALGRGQGRQLQLDEIAIESRRRRGRRAAPVEAREIEIEQVGEQRGDAPAVDDGVVLGDAELEAVGAAQVHVDAQQRRPAMVEGAPLLGRDPGGHRGVLRGGRQGTQVGDRERHAHLPVDELPRHAEAAEIEAGAQHRMAPGELVHRGAQAGQVERRPQVGAHQVVIERRRLAAQLAVVQHARLQGGKRIGVLDPGRQQRPVGRGDQRERLPRRRRSRRQGRIVRQAQRQLVDGGLLEDAADGQLQAALARRRHHLDAAQRVAAELEEVVVDADSGGAQDLAPDLGQVRSSPVAGGV